MGVLIIKLTCIFKFWRGLCLDFLNNFLPTFRDNIYVYVVFELLIICGLYFTFKTRFMQFRFVGDSFKYLTEKSGKGKVSSFQALMTCTASKVGTANIAGVATAIVVGGPGAIFWMWMMALIGSASSVVESTLAQMYKSKGENGKMFIGGPAYYINKALRKPWLGTIFSALFVFCYMFAFNALQSNNMSSAFETFIPNYSSTYWPWVIGGIFTLVVSLVVFGGLYRISFVSAYLVPFMASIYLLVGFYIMVTNISRMPEIFSMIFKDAFDFSSLYGGFAGTVILLGIKRGLLSNEAGMGSAPNSAATAAISHPMKQGLMQILSVSIDTLLICSASAFVILLSKWDLSPGMSGIPLMQRAVSSQVGHWGSYFVGFSVICFSFSAVIGNFGISEPNILYIKNSKKLVWILRFICLLAVLLGCVVEADLVWSLAEIAMAGIALLNLVVIFLLRNKFMACFKDYVKQRKQGKDPVFKAEECGVYDTTEWK